MIDRNIREELMDGEFESGKAVASKNKNGLQLDSKSVELKLREK
jgi:hypothetical protein